MSDSKGEALRFNEGKRRWGLVDFKSLEPMVKVLEFGANKYDDHNWKKGLDYVGVSESLMRHMFAWLDGEDIDPESGISHIGHIMCNAMFLSYYIENYPELDDRFKKKIKIDYKAFRNLYQNP
jgi:hypothetical protein